MFLNTYDDKAIKGPLEECLLISPLLIFSTSQRSKSKWKRLDLIEVSARIWSVSFYFNCLQVAKRLGNEKPAGLMEIEEIIWGVLQKMAQGEYTLLEGCKALANVLSLSTSTSAIQGHDYFHCTSPLLIQIFSWSNNFASKWGWATPGRGHPYSARNCPPVVAKHGGWP